MKFKKYSYNIVKSTNDVSLRKIKLKKKQGIIISNTQTSGRGRYGKHWISIKGNLFMSIFYKINNNTKLNKITKNNCKIIKRAIAKFINKKITIKAPNDLLINSQKFCGILQETCFNENSKFLIIGIGINVVGCPQINNYPTTYLNKYTKKKVDKLKIFKTIKQMFEKNLNKKKL
tara:strand:+ start:183 stop:707 length:525 start_codon:yes stop_codon:yes gene_type:complete